MTCSSLPNSLRKLLAPVLYMSQERKEGKGRKEEAWRQEMNMSKKGQEDDKQTKRTGGLFFI